MVKQFYKLDQYKFGVLGFRQDLLTPVLDEFGINYTKIENQDDIVGQNFDFIFASGVYYIVRKEVLDSVSQGIFGFHESPLPEGNGHAPIQWTVINNRPNLTVTLFKFEGKFDSGQIAYQYNVPIEETDVYEDMQRKRLEGVTECFRRFMTELTAGFLVLREQSGKGSYSPQRTPKDSELDANKSLHELWDQIRVCDNDTFPAFFRIGATKIYLRYEIENGKNN